MAGRYIEHSPTVLIAEDEEIIRYVLEKTLGPEFKIIASVGNGEAAVRAAQEHEPEIALLDISLPVLNGFEAAEKIAQAKPDIKIIIVSSYVTSAQVEEAFRRGAKGYVSKGRVGDLFEAIRAVMQGQSYRPHFGR